MKYQTIKAILGSKGFKEYAIGLFNSEKFNVIFDCNSGGLTVLDLDEEVVDWGVSEDDRAIDFIALIKKHANINTRADLPF
jgi:hypothetical protein